MLEIEGGDGEPEKVGQMSAGRRTCDLTDLPGFLLRTPNLAGH